MQMNLQSFNMATTRVSNSTLTLKHQAMSKLCAKASGQQGIKAIGIIENSSFF